MINKKPFVEWVLHGIQLPFTKTLYIDFSQLWLRSRFSELSEMLPPGLQSSFPRKKNLTRNSQVVHLFLVDKLNIQLMKLDKEQQQK